MEGIVPIVLATWVIVTIGLFGCRPGREAALIALIGGWAILPTAIYPMSGCHLPIGTGGSIHALAVPTSIQVNKALAIGLGCLVGVVLFDWPSLRQLRPIWLDAPMFVWCLVPIGSTLANGDPLSQGLTQSRSLVLAWGVPYLMGRIYVGDEASMFRLGLGVVVAGIISVPLGLVEWYRGPFLYTLVYGRHPYQSEGAVRLLGHRPLLFLEHGNQLGMWIATASIAAYWLWRSGRVPTMARLPAGLVVTILLASCLLFQSHIALGLTLTVVVAGFLGPIVRQQLQWRWRWRWRPRMAHVGLLVGILLITLATATVVVVKESGIGSGLRSQVRAVFVGVGKTSFTWRLARSEEFLPLVEERPLLGWGRPDWSSAGDGRFTNPVNLGLWLMSLGMFGVVGLIASTMVLILPVIEVSRRVADPEWAGGSWSVVALMAILLVVITVDSLFNSIILLPLLAAAGGIHSWSAALSPGRKQPR